jgi:hypothetical protein
MELEEKQLFETSRRHVHWLGKSVMQRHFVSFTFRSQWKIEK